MPVVRPFRALRYDPASVDVVAVIAPPYDVIGQEQHAELLARDPRNVVRLDLPEAVEGEPPDERYRRAARTLATWRGDGTLRKEPRPSLYAYEQCYRRPGDGTVRTQRGFFGRLRLEPYGEGVRRHERTLPGPREDRYRLLRAMGVNTSPVVLLYEDATGRAAASLAGIAAGSPDVDLVDDAGTGHRLWVVPDAAADEPVPWAGVAAGLAEVAGSGPLTIADGHHRYETALRYRDERRVGAPADDADPAWDYVLVLFVDAAHEPLTVLPTHRILRGLGEAGVAALLTGLGDWFDVAPAGSGAALAAAFVAPRAGGGGRFGLWTRVGGAELTARPAAFATATTDDLAGRLDVSRLGVVLERVGGIGRDALAGGDRVTYTHDAFEAVRSVDAAVDGADAAFLLEPTPVADVLAVAAAGEVMPEKSTYFYPKALTGLVINPHEW